MEDLGTVNIPNAFVLRILFGMVKHASPAEMVKFIKETVVAIAPMAPITMAVNALLFQTHSVNQLQTLNGTDLNAFAQLDTLFRDKLACVMV
jgi:hypothetical protein